MTIHPIKLDGPWDEGYALDRQIIKSVPLGEDAYGNMRFDSTRSDIGELLYQLKYRRDYSKVDDIMELTIPFLDEWDKMKRVSYVIPVPSSRVREVQPVHLIAERIAEHLNVGWSPEILEKISTDELKGTSAADKSRKIEGTIIKRKNAKFEVAMLLMDDLFESGSTLRECVRVLRQDPKIKDIYVLCMTKTKEKS